MRPPTGPADLRNSRLNADKELREIMRPPPGPANLRNSHFCAGKELREIMKPKAQETPTLESVEAAAGKLADELEYNIKKRDNIIQRLKASLDDEENSNNDDSNVTTDTGDYNTNKEGEVEPSEDELTNVGQHSDSDLDTYDDFHGIKVRNPDEPLSPPSPINVPTIDQ